MLPIATTGGAIRWCCCLFINAARESFLFDGLLTSGGGTNAITFLILKCHYFFFGFVQIIIIIILLYYIPAGEWRRCFGGGVGERFACRRCGIGDLWPLPLGPPAFPVGAPPLL